MDEKDLQNIASQLRQPSGEMGTQVAKRMNESNAFMNRFTIGQLGIEDENTILEIGPGNGFFAREILENHPTVSYHGVDFSELMIAECEKMNASFIEEGRAGFHLTPADTLPFPSQTFDRIFGVNVVYFWDQPEKELKELSRVLKTNGRMVLGIRSDETLKAIPFTKFGFNIYSREDVTGFIRNTGLNVANITSKEETIKDFKGEDQLIETWAVTITK